MKKIFYFCKKAAKVYFNAYAKMMSPMYYGTFI